MKETGQAKIQLPAWAEEMQLVEKSRSAHMFVLHGNTADRVRDWHGKYLSVYQYLNELFSGRGQVMIYSISAGLQFANLVMEKAFKEAYLKKESKASNKSSAMAKAAQNFCDVMTVEEMIGGRLPDVVFPVLNKALTDDRTVKGGSIPPSERKLLIIDFVHNVAPPLGQQSGLGDRINIEWIERWARNDRIRGLGNTIVLITDHLEQVESRLYAISSGIYVLRVSKPTDDSRRQRWAELIEHHGMPLESGLDLAMLTRISSGLSLSQINGIVLRTVALGAPMKAPLTTLTVKTEKKRLLEAEFGGRLKVEMPDYGFDYFGGKDYLKRYCREIMESVSDGVLRRVPMGMLAVGPPGTGKTFFFSCFAKECGFNFVQISNPRSMWVGQSEAYFESILAILDDLSPVVVVEDEADQSEAGRDVPNGDSGVSNRLRQMKFMFCSDPKRRGRVIWVRITNRSDLLDTAYRRKGRSDDIIAFVPQDEAEFTDVFKVMFARYQIPVDITNFASFAKKTAAKEYCTGSDIEWMVLEADKASGRAGRGRVFAEDLNWAIEEWETDVDRREFDRQTILAIKGSTKRLRPENWQEVLRQAESRLGLIRKVPDERQRSEFAE